ncbi:hypothetical protein [Kutzneria kofuensis]|uniref:Uncharacterized protein n=1 Tax=Kutzneria kofuensis TaxID=103725 RepID=A0A7W9NKJ1_9PSEU|nr:hypothetical protein [Kutzneria kofuensis]MBB5895328.1 hypothetical protein [Kutzneria kofuensis]
MTWSFETAREPAEFAAAIDRRTGVEHAAGRDRTLCGIDMTRLDIYRHLFRPSSGCSTCATAAAAAPTEPSAQERLHDRVLAAAASPLRDRVIAALRRGADLRLGITGPAPGVARHYAKLDQVVEGHAALATALDTTGRVTISEVVDPGGNFVIVHADGATPVIGRRAG